MTLLHLITSGMNARYGEWLGRFLRRDPRYRAVSLITSVFNGSQLWRRVQDVPHTCQKLDQLKPASEKQSRTLHAFSIRMLKKHDRRNEVMAWSHQLLDLDTSTATGCRERVLIWFPSG